MQQQYRQLLKFRTLFIISAGFGWPLFLWGIFQIMTFFEIRTSIIVLTCLISALLSMLFGQLFFLAKDICPWCKQNFFSTGMGMDSNLLFRKHCVHCRMPKNET